MNKLSENDIERLFPLHKDGYTLHYEKRKDLFEAKTDEEVKKDLEIMLETNAIIILEEEDQIVGYATYQIKKRKTKYLFVDEMYIIESKRHSGYGTRLFNELKKIAQTHQCERIELNCWDWNESAKKFYQKQNMSEQRAIWELKL